jgi:hypothetical protein
LLRPLKDLSPDVDMVFIPEGMLGAARRFVAEDRIMSLVPGASYQPAFDEFLQQLEAGQELSAPRAADEAAPPGGKRRVIVRYRGSQRID